MGKRTGVWLIATTTPFICYGPVPAWRGMWALRCCNLRPYRHARRLFVMDASGPDQLVRCGELR